MGKSQNVLSDFHTFIEYQQVLKEKQIVANTTAKKQVFETYHSMLNTKVGKQLMDQHFKFKTATVTLTSEKAFLKEHLPTIIKELPSNLSIQRMENHMQLKSAIQSEVKDHADRLTSDKIHPHLRENPQQLKHALGTLSRVAGMRQEKNRSLSHQLSTLNTKMTNLLGNLLMDGHKQTQLAELMDKVPTQSKDISKTPGKNLSQQLGI